MPRRIIAIVGPGDGADPGVLADAEGVGALLARAGWVVLTGGRAAGVMDAASRGARRAGGLAIGLLPGAAPNDASPALDVALATGLGEARDAVIAQASDAVVACGMNPGTAAEVALALKAGKRVVLVRPDASAAAFFRGLSPSHVRVADSAEDVVGLLGDLRHTPGDPPAVP